MFEVSAQSYDRMMGRYSTLLAVPFADFAGVASGDRVLDVGSGPGALTQELVRRGVTVSAADPSEPFVAAIRERHPDVDVRQAPAEELPFADGEFDATLAQLVVQFMTDAVAGVREMARVTRPGGTVAACVWDATGGRSPLSPVWGALEMAREQDMYGVAPGQLRAIFEEAGLDAVEEGEVSASLEHPTFDGWWEPFTLGVGPVGAAIAQLTPEQAGEARERARTIVGEPPIRVPAVALAARGRVR